MTENQYVRANRTVLFTVLIVFGYIALTVMAALGVGDGHNKGKILIQFVVALAVIIVSIAAYILKKKTRVCELTIAVSMALGYVVLILLNSTDGVWTYVLPLIMASMVYLNEKLILWADGVAIAANVIRLIMDYNMYNGVVMASRVLAILVLVIVTCISLSVTKLLKQFFAENMNKIEAAAVIQKENNEKMVVVADNITRHFGQAMDMLDELEKSIDISHSSMKDIAESTESTAEAIQRQAAMCAEIQENTDIAEKEISEMINNGKATFYIGFDPTADSLHVGHFMALCLMKRLQMAGNKPIVLIGGGTGMIGDPSGKSDMRKMMTQETVQHNCDCFKKQMSRFIDFSEGKAIMVNNADWLMNLNYIELLREVGACFSVNKMLTFECYKQRMERGLTFLEFNYMIMQSYDFYMLFQKYGCNMQFGGDDQWSNMLGGTELIRRKLGKDAHAMTITLLTDSNGKKMGKTAGNAVWLDPNKTSPYEFFQYWRNVDDADVMKCIKMLTFIPLDEIEKMESWEGSQLNEAKMILAYELTKLVHGEEEAKKAKAGALAIFGGSGDSSNMPTVEIEDADFKDGYVDIQTLLVKAGLCQSRGDARRNVEQGGVTANDEKATLDTKFTKADFGDGIVIRRGKKNFKKAVLK